jgi:hypothetical protein
MVIIPRRPCFQKIWRDLAADEAWFQFTDQSIYHYTPAGSAANACDCATTDPHGTTFNHTTRIPKGSPGYTKVLSVPGTATLVYEYPPYDNPAGPCQPCYGHNTDIAALSWTNYLQVGGSASFTASGADITVNYTGTGIFQLYAVSDDMCFNSTPHNPTIVHNGATSDVYVGVAQSEANAIATRQRCQSGVTSAVFTATSTHDGVLYLVIFNTSGAIGTVTLTLQNY